MRAYEAVTMEAVAAEAGVSKMTVYSHFGDKETLFERVVLAVSSEVLALFAASAPGDLRARLEAFGRGLLTVMLREVCTTEHMMPAIVWSDRPLAERFYAAGPGRVREALAEEIAAAAGRGELVVDDPNQAAEELISLWQGSLPVRLLFGLAEGGTLEDIERRARRGVRVFLRAYGAEAPPRPDDDRDQPGGGTDHP